MMRWLADRIIASAQRTPYFHLEGYMKRWWLLGADNASRNKDNPLWSTNFARRRSWLYHWITDRIAVRVHHILRGDLDRCLHDHPFWNVTIVLRGGYWEIVPVNQDGAVFGDDGTEEIIFKWRGPWSIVFRRAKSRHKILIGSSGKNSGSWSLFICGRKSQPWGFYTPTGKVGWREYLGIPANDNAAADDSEAA